MEKRKKYFTLYEKIWFIGITCLAVICTIIFPEDDINGINGKIVLALYLADTVLNVACELLIAKQSKWNFIVSLGVEAAEIACCIVLAQRWTTCAVTIFFWIPIDIISFINWGRHPDDKEDLLTEVRELSVKQAAISLAGVAVWTVITGFITCYFTENILISDFFENKRDLEIITCYMDACVSALGIANGVFIWLRFKEQWIAWYAYSILELAINIIAIIGGHPGQSVLLVLKIGYLSNTTYGYIRWKRYIRNKSWLTENVRMVK